LDHEVLQIVEPVIYLPTRCSTVSTLKTARGIKASPVGTLTAKVPSASLRFPPITMSLTHLILVANVNVVYVMQHFNTLFVRPLTT
jgi:hypothetical protein